MKDDLASVRFFVIGVGPGDPDLLTLKAVRLIGMADVVAYPVTRSGESRARRTAGEFITALHVELPYELEMSVDPKPAQRNYDAAAREIRGHLDAGRTVALLCEGDPFFYGSAMHVYERLASDYPTCVVPGVSSLTACAAAAGRPLARRNDVLQVVPAPLDEAALADAFGRCDAAVVIKIGRHFDKVRRAIETAGRLDDAVLIADAGGDAQEIRQLSKLARGEQIYFSTILIGSGRSS